MNEDYEFFQEWTRRRIVIAAAVLIVLVSSLVGLAAYGIATSTAQARIGSAETRAAVAESELFNVAAELRRANVIIDALDSPESHYEMREDWLETHFEEVKQNGADPCFVTCHEPVYCAECHVGLVQ